MTKPSQKTLAILTADIHLSLRPPVARSAENDWLAAQGRYLDQVTELAKANSDFDRPCPVIVAGDVFDKPNPPPELINWAIKRLPKCIAVPGQHDLQHHRLEDLRKSAFWTLVEAGVVTYLRPGHPIEIPDTPLRLHGFPWNCPVKPLEKPHDMITEVAVVHAYVWKNQSTAFEGASQENRSCFLMDKMEGYDLLVTGDNHIPFASNMKTDRVPSRPALFNCGCLIPRKADERNHNPSIGLLKADGLVERHYLDVSKDKWLETDALEAIKDHRTENLIRALADVADAAVDFEGAVRMALENPAVPDGVRRAVLQKLGECKK